MDCDLVQSLIDQCNEMTSPYPREKFDNFVYRTKYAIRTIFGEDSLYWQDVTDILLPGGKSQLHDFDLALMEFEWKRNISQLRSIFNVMLEECKRKAISHNSMPKNVTTNPVEAFRIFDDLAKQFIIQEYSIALQNDFRIISNHLERLRATIEKAFGVESSYLRELHFVKFRYPRAKQRNAVDYFNKDKGHVLGVLNKIIDELRIISPGISLLSEDISRPVSEYQPGLSLFHRDYPPSTQTAFIMMSFADTPAHREITAAIKDTLKLSGIVGLRADDKEYHSDLYWNILTYMQGCSFGIAVFDNMTDIATNPNVALEVGYMLALNKRVCLLKDKTLPNLQVDLIGKLYRTFDPEHITQTIQITLSDWVDRNRSAIL